MEVEERHAIIGLIVLAVIAIAIGFKLAGKLVEHIHRDEVLREEVGYITGTSNFELDWIDTIGSVEVYRVKWVEKNASGYLIVRDKTVCFDMEELDAYPCLIGRGEL